MRTVGLLLFILFALAGLALWVAPDAHPAAAQGENLLVNPSFEGQYSSYVPETPQELADCPLNICTTAQIPQGWKPWWVKERPTDVNPEYKPAEMNVGSNRIHSGSRAAQYFSFWSTHKAGLRQTVTVPANAVVQFSVFGQAWITESDSSNVSDRSGTVNMRVGIDPTGGTNPYSPSVLWSGYQQPYDAYAPFSIQTQAQGDKVTVFTFSAPDVNPNSPEYGFKHNDIYWDDASLTVVGAGSAAAPPPPNPGGSGSGEAAPPQFVPQPTATPNAEGIIYAEVQVGDSMWAIAARAGITIDELLTLNNMTRDTVLRPGDLLIVGLAEPGGEETVSEDEQAGGEEAAGESTPASEATAEAEPTNTPEPTATPEAIAAKPEASTPEESTNVSVCLKAYDDANGNGVQDAGEALRPSVAFTISDGESVVSNYVTDGQSEPFCVEGLQAGNYRVTRSILPNEVLTTAGDRAISLSPGSSLSLDFGSYMGEETVASADTPDETAPVAETQPADEDDGGDGLLTAAVIGAIVVAVLLLALVLVIVINNRRANAA